MATRSDNVRRAQGASSARLDRLGMGVSVLCLLHCSLSVIVMTVAASGSSLLLNPLWHQVGIALAIVFGALALWQGYSLHKCRKPLLLGGSGLGLMAVALAIGHSWMEIPLTAAGVALVLAAHVHNMRAARR